MAITGTGHTRCFYGWGADPTPWVVVGLVSVYRYIYADLARQAAPAGSSTP